LLTRINY